MAVASIYVERVDLRFSRTHEMTFNFEFVLAHGVARIWWNGIITCHDDGECEYSDVLI
jgi:hypothetical protein